MSLGWELITVVNLSLLIIKACIFLNLSHTTRPSACKSQRLPVWYGLFLTYFTLNLIMYNFLKFYFTAIYFLQVNKTKLYQEPSTIPEQTEPINYS